MSTELDRRAFLAASIAAAASAAGCCIAKPRLEFVVREFCGSIGGRVLAVRLVRSRDTVVGCVAYYNPRLRGFDLSPFGLDKVLPRHEIDQIANVLKTAPDESQHRFPNLEPHLFDQMNAVPVETRV